jgi:hypothetical protein
MIQISQCLPHLNFINRIHRSTEDKVEIFHTYFVCFACILSVCFYSVNVCQSICSICFCSFLFIFVVNWYIHNIKWVSRTEMPFYNSVKWEIRVQFMTAHFATTVEKPSEPKLQVLPGWRNSNLIILFYKFPSFIIGI